MAQDSKPWGGIITGDAGPYTHGNWTEIWQYLLGSLADADTGILSNILNEILVTGAASPVTIASGVALVNGTFYLNDANETIIIVSAVGAGNTRIDRIVLRKDFAAQTVRIHRLAGTDAIAPAVPGLTQDATYWDMPLFQVLINVAGNITLTDERERLNTRTPSMTTAERDAMTAINGMVLYNETVAREQVRRGGAWLSLSGLTIADTQVYNAAAPLAWTDLDLSAVVGARPALVLLRIDAPGGNRNIGVRRNGDAIDYYITGTSAGGVAYGLDGAGGSGIPVVLLVATDTAGVIEWIASNADANTLVTVMAYIN